MKTEYKQINSEEMARNRHLEGYLKSLRPRGRCAYIGLGTGVNIPLLLAYFEHVTVIEPDGDLLDRFLRVNSLEAERVTLIQGPLEDVFVDRAVDSIFLIGVIEHFSNIKAAWRSLSRLASPSADIFVILNNPRSLHRQFGVATAYIRDCYEISESEGPSGHGHYKLYDVKDVLRLLKRLQFIPVTVSGFYVKPLPTYLMNGLASHIVSGFMKTFVHLPSDQHAYTFVHARRG